MISDVLFSEDVSPFDWSEAETAKSLYGPKGAFLAALPRLWTPPFVLVPAGIFSESTHRDGRELAHIGGNFIPRLRSLGGTSGKLIVRSSVIGESIWDRGRYKSVVISSNGDLEEELRKSITQVLVSAPGKNVALVVQQHIAARAGGEFGNLLRISKTRDHWELSTVHFDQTTTRNRLNTQRDEAADPTSSLLIKPGIGPERLFGPVAAWLNNHLHRGRSERLNCEWLTDHKQIFLVQLDEEDEDFRGVNPFQVRVAPVHRPTAASGSFLIPAEGPVRNEWDKLKVLDELWEASENSKPILFFVPLANLPLDSTGQSKLARDFRQLIGNDNIVVRTSVRSGKEKLPQLPRTECLGPDAAADWCLAEARKLKDAGHNLDDYAFVAHRFMAAKASAWVRAEPGNPLVEIHSLWGLPDALQYCPYDIWEVHLPTQVATDYPEYKSNMLLPREDGGWEYARVKNELARNLSIGRKDAIELATRTAAIADRIGRACHVMWFVGCVEPNGTTFNIPWYWTEAHTADRNLDRSNYKVVVISDPDSLEAFATLAGPRNRQAIELKPNNIDLMRDTPFIEAVGRTAARLSVPVILAGSTLGHAYYQLRREGCTIVTSGEKEYSRVRRNTIFGKLVRDKIPARIAQRREAEITRKVPTELLKGFLISKLLEEALEVRAAVGSEQKKLELADLYEVVRALAQAEGVLLSDVTKAADEKRGKAGGFEDGLILLQTAILGSHRSSMQETSRPSAQVLARKSADDTYEVPFSFFGFMEFDQPRSLVFEEFGVRLNVTLKSDRIELHISRTAEQLELPLDLALADDE